jgi:hypothetical protein
MADGLFDPSRLYQVLKEANLLPSHSTNSPPSGNTAAYNSSTNRIMSPTDDDTFLPHEMAHAVQFNLLQNAALRIQKKKKEGDKITEKENQFLEAAQKIFEEDFSFMPDRRGKAAAEIGKEARKAQLKTMYDPLDRSAGFNAYRTEPTELQGWGVGEMSSKIGTKKGKEGTSHLNPTSTTEFDLLLSMYQQLPANIRQTFTDKRRQAVKENREADNFREDPRWSMYRFDDIFSDPFKPTIK